jgi:hypothetical protein
VTAIVAARFPDVLIGGVGAGSLGYLLATRGKSVDVKGPLVVSYRRGSEFTDMVYLEYAG